MDTSEIYILMSDCEEIQSKCPKKFEQGTWWYNGDFSYCVGMYAKEYGGGVWLPLQDQLQEMCWELTGTKWTPFFALTMVRNFADALQLGEPDYVTLEQLWMAFYQKEVNNKVWDGGKWNLVD